MVHTIRLANAKPSNHGGPCPPPAHTPCCCSRARPQVAAGMGIYGPRTVFCIAMKDAPGCHEFLLMDDGKWMHVKETTEIGEQAGPGRGGLGPRRQGWNAPGGGT